MLDSCTIPSIAPKYDYSINPAKSACTNAARALVQYRPWRQTTAQLDSDAFPLKE
jgi:hypothetical protein